MNLTDAQDNFTETEKEYFAGHVYPKWHSQPLYSPSQSELSWDVYPGQTTDRPLPSAVMDPNVESYGGEKDYQHTQSGNLESASGDGYNDSVLYGTFLKPSKTGTQDAWVLCGWENLELNAPAPTVEEQQRENQEAIEAIIEWSTLTDQVGQLDHLKSPIPSEVNSESDIMEIQHGHSSQGDEEDLQSMGMYVGDIWYKSTQIVTASNDELKEMKQYAKAMSQCIKNMQDDIDEAKEHRRDWLEANQWMEDISIWEKMDEKNFTIFQAKWAMSWLLDNQEEVTEENREEHIVLIQGSMPYMRDKHYFIFQTVLDMTRGCTCGEYL
ncbi:hypothetical protein M231_07503 [Tremella mesenterica]|uniref:Uncharacterized protein n=1 Tax=Tremella mesenterica TaxID=5217 RepID=A0A4Q1B902_TREME|nr:uncharacterized protein TREMEDRAFT_64869 [Tremella mesenterica DSM 1558]EIW67003.1 hypothetical protein TREMEDRAFT_64869 [Tremella mesenterica DSM 1558]RXK35249.1 hypothetical protein M231_07503 [Tremella mesenterica]